jgi:dihydrofolate reductase
LTIDVVGETVFLSATHGEDLEGVEMRKIVAGLFMSLDGVVEAPDKWHFPYFNDEMGAAVGEQMAANDTMLLGRRTYQEFASYWPQQDSSVEPADFMNGTPKLVVSTTLGPDLEWENSTLVGDVSELVKIKEQDGRNIGITGSPTLVRSLLAEGLLDELTLLVHPIVIGSGKRLFQDMAGQVPLTLLDAATFRTGVQKLTYGPAAA